MKSKIICLLIFVVANMYSQEKSFNTIIFIDGKIMTHEEIKGDLIYKDSLSNQTKIPFYYEMGDLKISSEDYAFLKKQSSTANILINLINVRLSQPNINYQGELKIEWLDYRFLVIRITNLNRKKGTYYFGYSTPGMDKPFIKNEYHMFTQYKE